MANRPRQEHGKETTPTSFAEVTPRLVTQGHDFSLQAVIEMQRSIGELSAKTDRLISDVKSQGEKIDSVRMRLAWMTGGAAVVGFLIATVLAVLRFIPIWGASAGK
jgi:hypothetical protein